MGAVVGLLLRPVLRHIEDPDLRFRWAAWLLVLCIVGWPVSALSFARQEPQTVLGLSWGAMILTAIDIMNTAHVARQVET